MKPVPRSRLLLVELICDLAIFVLCAVVCVTLLVRARAMSRESTALTQCVYLAQSAAEEYLSTGRPDDAFGDKGEYIVSMDLDPNASLRSGRITVWDKNGNLLYALPFGSWEEVGAP